MQGLLVILLLVFLAAPGCAHHKPKAARNAPAPVITQQPGQKLILTPDSTLVGKVVRVNTAGRFAVMTFPIGHLPVLDQHLSVYRLGLKTGEIKVTGPQLDDKVVGDVVAGDVRAGDEVRDR